MEASQLRDAKQDELLAGLIDKLKATKEADGTTLFDHTTLAYGSNIQSIHYLDNCPTLITGGGSGIRVERSVLSAGNPAVDLAGSIRCGRSGPGLRSGSARCPAKATGRVWRGSVWPWLT
jgi:hypothetical protein